MMTRRAHMPTLLCDSQAHLGPFTQLTPFSFFLCLIRCRCFIIILPIMKQQAALLCFVLSSLMLLGLTKGAYYSCSTQCPAGSGGCSSTCDCTCGGTCQGYLGGYSDDDIASDSNCLTTGVMVLGATTGGTCSTVCISPCWSSCACGLYTS